MSTLTIPNTAVPNTTILSADFNGNMTAIAAWANGSIDDANIVNAGITGSSKLKSNSVNQAVMGLLSIGTPELIADCVTNPKVADDAIQEENVLDEELMTAKQLSGTSGPTTLTGTYQTIDSSVAKTMIVAPVLILWQFTWKGVGSGTTAGHGISIKLQRQINGGGWTDVQEWLDFAEFLGTSSESLTAEQSAVATFLDIPTAGSVEYRFQAKESSSTHVSNTVTIEATERELIVVHLKNAA